MVWSESWLTAVCCESCLAAVREEGWSIVAWFESPLSTGCSTAVVRGWIDDF